MQNRNPQQNRKHKIINFHSNPWSLITKGKAEDKIFAGEAFEGGPSVEVKSQVHGLLICVLI